MVDRTNDQKSLILCSMSQTFILSRGQRELCLAPGEVQITPLTYGEWNKCLSLNEVPISIQEVGRVELIRGFPVQLIVQSGGQQRNNLCTLKRIKEILGSCLKEKWAVFFLSHGKNKPEPWQIELEDASWPHCGFAYYQQLLLSFWTTKDFYLTDSERSFKTNTEVQRGSTFSIRYSNQCDLITVSHYSGFKQLSQTTVQCMFITAALDPRQRITS